MLEELRNKLKVIKNLDIRKRFRSYYNPRILLLKLNHLLGYCKKVYRDKLLNKLRSKYKNSTLVSHYQRTVINIYNNIVITLLTNLKHSKDTMLVTPILNRYRVALLKYLSL